MKKNARPVRRVKSVSLALLAKNVHRAKPSLLPRQKTKKRCQLKSNRKTTHRTTPKAIAHVVARVATSNANALTRP